MLVDYGKGTSPILPGIQCGSEDRELSECSRTEVNVRQCSSVAGVDCIGINIIFICLIGELILCLCIAAPCVTEDQTDCNQQNRGYYYFYNYYSWRFDCSCHSDCISNGDCCSDISVTENCFGNLFLHCRSGSKT